MVYSFQQVFIVSKLFHYKTPFIYYTHTHTQANHEAVYNLDRLHKLHATIPELDTHPYTRSQM